MRTLRALQRDERGATAQEQQTLARWSAWGAVPGVFDETRTEWSSERDELQRLLSDSEYAAARRTTINAHYTDPTYVRAIWRTLGDLGFDGGRVLEPGSGAGTFIGLAPEGAAMTGVELDPVSAAIAAALYPHADVHAQSFAEFRRPAGYFDAVVGNVPFADVRLHDPVHNRGGHVMHNHFLLKSLALTRPGGMLVALTSRFTMDQVNPAARREMNQLAELVGAVRLPAGAHRRAAGTEVVTDLLVMRRREDGETVRDSVWETVGAHRVDAHTVRTNNYFLDHPDHVLGTYRVGHGMYGEETLTVESDLTRIPQMLEGALSDVVRRGRAQGLTWTPAATATPTQPARVAQADDGLWEGHISTAPDGTFTMLVDGVHEPLAVPGTRARELRELLSLRDGARHLLTLEAESADDTPELDTARRTLRTSYAAYVARFGALNRFSTRNTGRVDPATGEQRLARVRPPVMNTFRKDPFNALVMALEIYDDATGTATPAQILEQRVVVPRTPVLGVDDVGEALAVTVEALGRADLEHIASLLGVDVQDARAQLGQLVYDDPADEHKIIPSAEYLSGNVLDKLDAARAAADRDPRYQVNVRALEEVVPTPLGVDEIAARLGAAWLDEDTHTQFVREILADPDARVIHAGGAVWDVKARTYTIQATSDWGTARMPAPAILKAVLEQRQIQVTDAVDGGGRVLNPTETEAAREKAGALQERFAEWVWEDPERAERLAATYNRMFNALVLRDYTAEGKRLTLPGLVSTFTPREHQRTAVARMIAEPAVGLFHEVGAGKTAEMAMGVMELRRLGLVNKPVVNVPNHMLEQFTREWLQLYPAARLLAASGEDLAGDGRRRFVARAATGDWDAIILTRGAFERIPVSRQTEADYLDSEMQSVRAMLARLADERGSGTVKRLEKAVAAVEERVRAKLDSPQDPGITFEETGIDYVVVDELHDFKNLMTVSNIPDAAIAGSQRATDLHMKLEYLRGRHGQRVVTGATATPIANSVTEAHVMQRLLRPDLLRAAGVDQFDAWAATFGEVVTEIEMSVTGGYKQKSRFARFQNVPEMLRTWHTFADVKTAEDLNLDRPLIAARPDGTRGPRTMILPPSDELVQYVEWLGERADAVQSRRVDATTDNMLKITTDGRKAALDLRLAGGQRTEDNKTEAAADKMVAIWQANKDRRYLDTVTGQVAAVPGALQLVFCDLGTPSANWNVYDELRRQLVRRGMPREQIVFMHEAAKDADKARLFAAARAGHVSVLVGSTQKMGVGTNVQARAVALHHLDCPWRPADLEQRDGRILRQGNQNPEIEIYRWVTERSFDAYSWQTVERKARFIAQVMRGRLDVREIEDVGDSALSFAEVKALASGNPLVMEREKALQAVTKYERLERAHHRNQVHLARGRQAASETLSAAEADLPALVAAAERSTSTAGDAFIMTVGGRQYASRTDAAAALRSWAHDHAEQTLTSHLEPRPLGVLCEVAGHTVTAAAAPRAGALLLREPGFLLELAGVPRTAWRVDVETAAGEGLGLVRQIEHRVERLPATVERVRTDIVTAQRDVTQAEAAQARPFKHAEQLAAARAELQRIESILNPPTQEPEAPKPSLPDQPSLATRAAALRAPGAPGVDTRDVAPQRDLRGPAMRF
ncbi:helicase-related protein [Cellulomonas sp. HD19AZ1]|uniref:helicase-related protein n=1 Tax=Cellulomonas sp. HD19AZ1 TaxID=2559593 RepID=UPI00107152D8|nr:helicase-related protein [Cellulomonas sp. HD19AZ1]TFH68133.1 helicase [Cellulomonas sp. HD19AZ1]